MFAVLSYDISSDKNRNAVFKLLKKFGLRVQYSVFEGELSRKDIKEIVKRTHRIIEPQDSLRIYPVCQACKSNIKIVGSGEVNSFPSVIIV